MNICILGAGAWGTAIALHMDRCGHAVTLVPRRFEQALALASTRENVDYLPGFTLPHRIQIGSELEPVLMEAEVVILACPSKGLRDLCQRVVDATQSAWQLKLFITLCKGLELESFKGPCEIVSEFFPDIACGVLSGPTYAGEVAQGKPTAMTLAVGQEVSDGARYQSAFSNAAMRVYLSNDVIGTELGGHLEECLCDCGGPL